MLCEICHTREANITYTEIVNGQKREQHLCQICAGEQTFAIPGALGSEISIGSILSGILQNYAKGLAQKSSNEPVCQRCGMTASDMIREGRLGCPECYNAFSMILEKNLRTVQGEAEHRGKVPVNAVKIDIQGAPAGRTAADVMNEATDEIVRRNEAGAAGKRRRKTEAPAKKAGSTLAKGNIEDYRKQLKSAVLVEDYEEAARLRDIIRQLEASKAAGVKVEKSGKKAGSGKTEHSSTSPTGKPGSPKTSGAKKSAAGSVKKTAKGGTGDEQ